jgi:hypothetical protein
VRALLTVTTILQQEGLFVDESQKYRLPQQNGIPHSAFFVVAGSIGMGIP